MNRKIIRSDSGNSATISASRGDRHGRHASDSDDLEAFTSALLEDLDPRGPAEALIAGRMALAAWRLSRRSKAVRPAAFDDRDERAFYRGLHALTKLRNSNRSRRWDVEAPPLDRPRFDDASVDELPGIFDREPLGDRSAHSPGGDSEFGRLWRDRLVLDPKVSERSPIIKGTFVTVGRIVSMIVDGLTWDDILRDHPELTEDDIRACLAFAVEDESSALPY